MLLFCVPYFVFSVLMLIFLSFLTLKERRRQRVSIGYQEDSPLARKARAHGNFCEYTPFFLILLGTYEFNGGYTYVIHSLGVAFFIGRILHAYGLIVSEPKRQPAKGLRDFIFRIRGMQITFGCLIILSILLIHNIVSYHLEYPHGQN